MRQGSPNFGKPFPMVGQGTEPCSGCSGSRSFVDLDVRSDSYSPSQWWTLVGGSWVPGVQGTTSLEDVKLFR